MTIEKDIENLKQLQTNQKLNELGESIKIAGLEWIANNLAIWRKSNDWMDKQRVAWYGQSSDLDRLVKDENPYVRAAVADRKRDCDLDILVDDPETNVRACVASQGRGKDLDKLVRDSSARVRAAVARFGRDQDLDILINDPDADVREEVAWHGRLQDFEILANDPATSVQLAAREGRKRK